MVLLPEQEVIQALLFSPQSDSTEKLRLFLEYLKLKGIASKSDGVEADVEEELEEIHIEPVEPVEEMPQRRSSPSSLMMTGAGTGAVKRGRGRPRLLSNRVTVSCRPDALRKQPSSKSSKPLPIIATPIMKRRGRPPKRRGSIPKKFVAVMEGTGLERLAASVAEVGVDIPLEADFTTNQPVGNSTEVTGQQQ